MKTFNTITLTMIFSLLINISFATGYQTLKMDLSNGKTIEVLQKTEECLQESIPGYQQSIQTYLEEKSTILVIPPYTEKTVSEEDFTETLVNQQKTSFKISHVEKEFMKTLALLTKPEETVNESEIDTRKIYDEIMTEKANQTLSADRLQQFIKPEKEIDEELNFSILWATKFTK
ncbi:MAG: hypothetical protein ACOCYO_03905 [Bacteroidota bacterium]